MNRIKQVLKVFLVLILISTSLINASASEVKINLEGINIDGYKYSFEVDYTPMAVKWNGKEQKLSSLKVTAHVEKDENNLEHNLPLIENGYVLKENIDYTVQYYNNYRVGNASFVILGQGKFEGTITKNFEIQKNSVSISYSTLTTTSAKVKFKGLTNANITKYQLVVKNSQNKTVFMKDNAKSGVNYSTGNKLSKGKAYKIIVIAWSKDEKGKAYSYELGSKSFNARNATTVTVSNIATKSAKFKFAKINDKAIKNYSITIKDSKNKTIKTIKKASGNKVYSLTKLKTNAKYTIIVKATTKDATYVVCSKSFKTLPIVSKATISLKSGSEMAQVNWKKLKGVTHYELYRATSKKGKFLKVRSFTRDTTSFTQYILSTKKTYYYKLRGYVLINKKKVYGKWSDVKSVRVQYPTSSTYYLRTNIKTNCTTVYAKGFNGKFRAVKAFVTSAGTAGKSKPILGTHYTLAKYRWKFMHEDCYTQYATRIVGHYLFHSVPYSEPKPNTLWNYSYNRLGNFASDGCIRMDVASVKWIYDHCPLRTKVVVVYSSKDELKKPVPKKNYAGGIKRNWDPTDPLPNNPWN